nr:xylulose kinase-1 [Tanacetum cinerariifolium]
MNTDHNLWKIIQNGNIKKSLGRDSKGGIIILPPISFEEHVAVQRETKARTLLLQSLLKNHMADFHHLDDAREIWLAVKARFGGNEESKKMRKPMLKQAFSESSVSEVEGLHKGYDRECNVKKVDEKARYSAFKISEVKIEEPKVMVSIDSMLNWKEHEEEYKFEEAEQVYGLMAGFESDFVVHTGNAAGSVHSAAAEFAMIWHYKKKVRILSANLENTTNPLKYSETLYDQAKLEKKEWEVYIGSDEVCDLSTPSVFDPDPDNREDKSLYDRFVKVGKLHEVSPPITGTFMPTSYKSDLEETQETFGSKSNTSSITTSESNNFVSCDNSDKSSASETYDFASRISSPKSNDSFSNVD